MRGAPKTRACDLGHAVVTVDYRSGAVHIAAGTAAQAWQRAAVRAGPSVPSWGTREVPFGLAPLPRVSAVWMARAVVALVVVLAAQRMGRASRAFPRLVRVLELAAQQTRSSATPGEVTRAIHAVRRASFVFPTRVACLEESTAAVLVLRSCGASVRWCHGVAPDPITLHAWVETHDGEAPAEPSSTSGYTIVRTIPDNDKDSL